MICQNCGAAVDNDLIFCTSCGGRLGANAMNESVVTKTSLPKRKSNLKWFVLIVALIAIPVSVWIAYRLFNNSQNVSLTSNTQTTNNSVSSANDNRVKNSTNQPTNILANTTNSNFELTNQNSNAATNSNDADNTAPANKQTQIVNEQIEIAPNKHIAYPFKLDSNGEINGSVKTLRGESIIGYVYLKDMYDEHFPDATYKIFSFDSENQKVGKGQPLVKGDYVLVFVNESSKSAVIQTNFHIAQ